MKKDFFDYLVRIMPNNPDIYFISAGLGWPRTDELKEKFPNRYIQTEASEQTALDIAVGLAYAGKTPITYTITPFYLRAFETIRTYINHENLNVKMIGAGRDDDYSKHDGFSHDAGDIVEILNTQRNIVQFFPRKVEDMQHDMDRMIKYQGPMFLSIKK